MVSRQGLDITCGYDVRWTCLSTVSHFSQRDHHTLIFVESFKSVRFTLYMSCGLSSYNQFLFQIRVCRHISRRCCMVWGWIVIRILKQLNAWFVCMSVSYHYQKNSSDITNWFPSPYNREEVLVCPPSGADGVHHRYANEVCDLCAVKRNTLSPN